MSKKRKCRYTSEELAIHEEAVKLRKMTDRQLVEAFHKAGATEVAPSAEKVAQERPKDSRATRDTTPVKMLLQAISDGKCKGVGGATAYKISRFASEMGLV